ncbi:hypothetical protein [Listeria sp. ILCC797]|uniref:hypothetical protein n=1 Tax=Listeria sp. ILCC797 TaxID=1918333 RepID=UPI000B596D2D|nr:hypothetical protein [Listeria sp. ILCC797]
MQPPKQQPDLTGLSPFQAVQTARANQMALPLELSMQVREAKREAQNYQLKRKMKPYYQEVFATERTLVVARVENLTDEWRYAIQKHTKEMKENHQGKAIQALARSGEIIAEHVRKEELKKAPDSLAPSMDSVIRVPSHPLLPLI